VTVKIILRNIAYASCAILYSACEKETSMPEACSNDAIMVRIITNQRATVQASQGNFYLVEQGAIDTRLVPCNLAKEFQEDNLQVTISGEVKATTSVPSGPCCTENIIILKITR